MHGWFSVCTSNSHWSVQYQNLREIGGKFELQSRRYILTITGLCIPHLLSSLVPSTGKTHQGGTAVCVYVCEVFVNSPLARGSCDNSQNWLDNYDSSLLDNLFVKRANGVCILALHAWSRSRINCEVVLVCVCMCDSMCVCVCVCVWVSVRVC